MNGKRILTTEYNQQYPVFSIVLAYVLILLTPFLSSMTSYAAFAICLYRIVRYDSKVFATDYALLLPVNVLFRMPGGLTLTVFLCLIAAAVYMIREGLQANRLLVILLLLLNYMLLRMQTNINDFVLCFGQICVLYVLLPKQDALSTERTTKAYCFSLLIASLFALVFRGQGALQAILGAEEEAIWGTGILRFQGLMTDPNYYMTMIVVGLAVLAKLKESKKIRLVSFLLATGGLATFGVLTYSKTFFLMLVLVGTIYIIWQFRNKKVFLGIALAVAVVLAAEIFLLSEDSPFAIVISRFLNSEDLSDLTTGRTDIYSAYFKVITKNPLTFFFGYGMNAPGLEKDAHNIYLEIMYYTGTVGLTLILTFFISLGRMLIGQAPEIRQQNAISKYIVLLMVIVLYFSLHGIFRVDVYGNIFMAFLAMIITTKQEPDAQA